MHEGFSIVTANLTNKCFYPLKPKDILNAL